ncbi:MAG: hypothetical protein M3336_13790 [Chloroflexota bacterium]|nr:hypothetical protein [Chloroflexota bacterium]
MAQLTTSSCAPRLAASRSWPKGKYTAVGPGITHQIPNVGQQVYREILVELKGPSVAASAQPSEDNGRSPPSPLS